MGNKGVENGKIFDYVLRYAILFYCSLYCISIYGRKVSKVISEKIYLYLISCGNNFDNDDNESFEYTNTEPIRMAYVGRYWSEGTLF